jgi:hypothetical protein
MIVEPILTVGGVAGSLTAVTVFILKVAMPVNATLQRISKIEELLARDYERAKKMQRRQNMVLGGLLNIYRHIQNDNEKEKIAASYEAIVTELAETSSED